MTKPARHRLIALFAAYAVALQGLLLPLTVAAFAAPDNALCVTAGAATHRPAGHNGGCPCDASCGMQCNAPSPAGPPPQDIVVLYFAQSERIASPPAAFVSVPRNDKTAHGPRAPPVV
jgi:hypothetical protein